MSLRYEAITEKDLPFLKEIYDYYILNSTAIYSLEEISLDELKSIIPIGDPEYLSYMVYNEDNVPVGFCYYNRFKPRTGYKRSVEITLYFKPEFTGFGYGSQVLTALEEKIREKGFGNIMSLISGYNTASMHLFEKNGYVLCAHIRNVAEKFGKLGDLKMYQKELD